MDPPGFHYLCKYKLLALKMKKLLNQFSKLLMTIKNQKKKKKYVFLFLLIFWCINNTILKYYSSNIINIDYFK